MEQDIKILERYITSYKKDKNYCLNCPSDEDIESIEHLIKAYKELEEKLNETLNANLALVQGNANSISVSLIKETIEEYKKIIDKYDKQMENDEDTDLSYEEARNYMCKIESYKELLEKRR